MRTVLVGQQPEAVATLLAQRAARGADRYDEVWEGELHVAPAPRASHGDVDRQLARILYEPARAAGLHGVEEMLVVDPEARTVEWFRREREAFVPAPGSVLLGVDDLAARLDWPPLG